MPRRRDAPGDQGKLPPARRLLSQISSSSSASDSATPPPAADDKVLRRRLQYKMHQRRHRAKQKQRVEFLEKEVHDLLADISSLELQSKRLRERNVFATRGTAAGRPLRVALEYFNVYEYGFSPRRCEEQERFLQGVMHSAVEGPDYVGVDFIKHQWRLYGHFFASTRFQIRGYDVDTVGDMTVVVVDAVISIRLRRDGVTTLYPSLSGNEELIQEVIGKAIVAPGKYRFIFDADGAGSWLGGDFDFVGGLQESFQSLEKVALFMESANMSFSTGQIQCQPDGGEGHPGMRRALVDHRHHLDFLLSK